MLPDLIRLDDGTLIDPRWVARVEALHRTEPTAYCPQSPDRVVVVLMDGGTAMHRVINCESRDAAEAMRDLVGAEVQAARRAINAAGGV